MCVNLGKYVFRSGGSSRKILYKMLSDKFKSYEHIEYGCQ